MEGFVKNLSKGDVVVTNFPFSDLTSSVKRPALVIANLKGKEIILCQITSKNRPDPYKINLKRDEFEEGNLNLESFIMPSRLFTLRESLIKQDRNS